MAPKSCVTPDGRFRLGIHKPRFQVDNLRIDDAICCLGRLDDGRVCENQRNFPPDRVEERHADRIYEIPNPLPFRGTSYIIKSKADRVADDPSSIRMPPRPRLSMSDMLKKWNDGDLSEASLDRFFRLLPRPVRIALATSATDPADLARMAEHCCRFVHDPDTGRPTGLAYTRDASGGTRPDIADCEVFEALGNNPDLPDDYKEVMVLRPGVQGDSEIVGEWRQPDQESHVFEYLRRNSYIPWGHYAANMAHDAIRYRARDLTPADVQGMRHLYYQRTYVRMARHLNIPFTACRNRLSVSELETLRRDALAAVARRRRDGEHPPFTATLWGWNFGFDYAPSGYRLHASHQQVHQQYALIPADLSPLADEPAPPAFAFGDLVADACKRFRREHGVSFFDAYIQAIRNNRRTDDDPGKERSLVLYEDDRVMLFTPKAQTSQWEIQLMPLGPVGNILEADTATRESLDRALLLAEQTLERMGARMVTHFEASKRFDADDTDQRLLYIFMPKLPYSPGSFTEAQLRWISGHYPEDFAAAFRACMTAPHSDH